MAVPRIRLGVSSCLLGERVRYDGDHKRDAYICDTLAECFELIPLCPELAIGLGVPRPPIQLVERGSDTRAVGVQDPNMDVTDALQAYARNSAARLADISGYLCKARSPSCGLFSTPIHVGNGRRRKGSGRFAAALQAALPLLPMEEEGRLNDPDLRDNFLERVFAYRRWQLQMRNGISPARVVAFHGQHKLSLMAHGAEHLRGLDRLVAAPDQQDVEAWGQHYIAIFMRSLQYHATRTRHSNVLRHIMGHFKKNISADDKQELRDCIEQYRRGAVPRIAPITLLKHHLREHPHPYLQQQRYLYPEQDELQLRSGL